MISEASDVTPVYEDHDDSSIAKGRLRLIRAGHLPDNEYIIWNVYDRKTLALPWGINIFERREDHISRIIREGGLIRYQDRVCAILGKEGLVFKILYEGSSGKEDILPEKINFLELTLNYEGFCRPAKLPFGEEIERPHEISFVNSLVVDWNFVRDLFSDGKD